MYSNLKGKNLVMLPNGKTMAFKPARAGRDGPPASEEKALLPIEAAMRRHEPIYFIQHVNGSVYDVQTNKINALKERDALRTTTPNGYNNVQCYERKNGALVRLH
jgi:hypothetical protein